LSGDGGFQLLQQATNLLLSSSNDTLPSALLWTLQYEQRAGAGSSVLLTHADNHAVVLPPVPLDLATVDSVLDHVQEAWQRIMGDGAGEFLVFADRETYDDDE
jgi:hypothetical protein